MFCDLAFEILLFVNLAQVFQVLRSQSACICQSWDGVFIVELP